MVKMRAKFINESREKDKTEELRKELGLSDEEFNKLTFNDIFNLLNAPQAFKHEAASDKEIEKELKDIKTAFIFDPKNQCYGYIEKYDRFNHIVNIVCTHNINFEKLKEIKRDKVKYNLSSVNDNNVGNIQRRYNRVVNKIKRESRKVQNMQSMLNDIKHKIN